VRPGIDPASSRLGAYICVLALYLAFTGVLLGFGYGLWPALVGASTACVVAGEVSRRVITAGIASALSPAIISAPHAGLADLLVDLGRVLDRSRPVPGQDDGTGRSS
jgi:hypothetical protein